MKHILAGRWVLNGLGVVFALVLIIASLLIAMPDAWIGKIIGGKGSDATGREFAVDGGIDIDWDWTTPTMRIGKIRLSNTEGAKDPQMVEIENLEFKIKIWKLFMFKLDLPELKIDSPKIILEKYADGAKNWDMPALSGGNAATNAALPDKRSNFPLIGLVTIKNGNLIYRDEAKNLTLDLGVDTVQGNVSDENDAFELSGEGTLQDQVFTIAATGGSLQLLRDSGKDYPLKVNLGMGATKINIDGTFKDPVKLEGVNAVLDMKGDNMADLFYLTGIPLPPTPAYTLNGALKKEGDVWRFEEFKGTVGESNLSGNLSHDISGERGLTTAEVTSTLLDMKDLGGFIGAKPEGEKQEKAADRVLPDMSLNLDRLRASDLDISLKADKVVAPGLPVESMNVRFNLKDGILTLDPMDLGMAGGMVDGKLILDGTKDMPDVSMDLTLRKLSLKSFFNDTRFESFSSGRFGGRIQLAGQGKSLADVLAVSNGHVTVAMSGGQISLVIVEAVGIDIGELTPLLLGEDKNTNIRCAVGDFGVKNGLLTSKIFVFDTTDTNIQGEATINLKNEALDIRAEANPKDASILALRTPITIKGTMKKPSIGIDPANLAVKGGVAAALGAIFPPLAAIPFLEFGLGEDSDCRDLIGQAKANTPAAAPTSN